MLSADETLCGVEVRVFESQATARVLFQKTRAALELISAVDAVRIHKIRRDLKGILFTSSGGAAFFPHLRICRIGLAYAARVSALELAMTIVHESTHARLFRVGRGYAVHERELVEKVCVHAEVAFARRYPDSGVLIDQSLTRLGMEWWKPEAMVTEERKQLARLGWPEWLVRLVSRRTKQQQGE